MLLAYVNYQSGLADACQGLNSVNNSFAAVVDKEMDDHITSLNCNKSYLTKHNIQMYVLIKFKRILENFN